MFDGKAVVQMSGKRCCLLWLWWMTAMTAFMINYVDISGLSFLFITSFPQSILTHIYLTLYWTPGTSASIRKTNSAILEYKVQWLSKWSLQTTRSHSMWRIGSRLKWKKIILPPTSNGRNKDGCQLCNFILNHEKKPCYVMALRAKTESELWPRAAGNLHENTTCSLKKNITPRCTSHSRHFFLTCGKITNIIKLTNLFKCSNKPRQCAFTCCDATKWPPLKKKKKNSLFSRLWMA